MLLVSYSYSRGGSLFNQHNVLKDPCEAYRRVQCATAKTFKTKFLCLHLPSVNPFMTVKCSEERGPKLLQSIKSKWLLETLENFFFFLIQWIKEMLSKDCPNTALYPSVVCDTLFNVRTCNKYYTTIPFLEITVLMFLTAAACFLKPVWLMSSHTQV